MKSFTTPVQAEAAAGSYAPGPRNPLVYALKRNAPSVTPDARVAVTIEMVRASPYRAVPVVDVDGRFVGMATEAALSRALLAACTDQERANVRELPTADIAEPANWWAVPMMTAAEVAVLFDRSGKDVLPVIGSAGAYCGLIGQGDLVRDLSRRFQPPSVGGMATPLGVYLTTGRVSGGAGLLGLMLTGLLFSVVSLVATVAVVHAVALHPLAPMAPLLAWVPADVHETVASLAANAVLGLVLLTVLRLSPVAGFHAAEHQVVHAIERGEPLLPERVCTMPRVHPRCGTNFVAGAMLFLVTYDALGMAPASVRFMLSGALALAYWRPVGSWLQQTFTTRPAKAAQIDSAIRAAHEVLDRHSQAPTASAVPLRRLWQTGMLQVMAGFALGIAVMALLAWLSPPLGVILNPVLRDIWSN